MELSCINRTVDVLQFVNFITSLGPTVMDYMVVFVMLRLFSSFYV